MSNVIMICVDSLRRDRLMAYGYPINTTPFLNEYFGNSYKFNAISPSTWTPTVFASIFSSLYPWEHKVLRDRKGELIEGYKVKSSGLLKFKDYYKVCITGNPWIHPRYNISKDFDYVNYVKKSWYAEDLNNTMLESIPVLKEKEKFLLFLHYMDVHEPYDETFMDKVNIAELKKNYGDGEIDIERLKRVHKGNEEKYKIGNRKWTWLEENIYYNASILKVDHYVAEAINMLEESNLLENAIIILFADHGEDMRDHGRINYPRHGHSLYNEILSVPLIIKSDIPIAFDPAEYVELRTLFGFIYDIIQGNSLEKYSIKDIVSHVAYKDEIYSIIDRKQRLKYIHNFTKNSSELYDLKNDWYELHNITSKMDIIGHYHGMIKKIVDPGDDFKRSPLRDLWHQVFKNKDKEIEK